MKISSPYAVSSVLPKVTLVLVVCLLLVLCASPASATIYACKAKQAVVWEKGRLVPDTSRYPMMNTELRFDNETGKMWIRKTDKIPFGPLSMRIINKEADEHWDLVAIQDKESEELNHDTTVFRIRAFDKKQGLIFFLYEDASDSVTVGRCDVLPAN